MRFWTIWGFRASILVKFLVCLAMVLDIMLTTTNIQRLANIPRLTPTKTSPHHDSRYILRESYEQSAYYDAFTTPRLERRDGHVYEYGMKEGMIACGLAFSFCFPFLFLLDIHGVLFCIPHEMGVSLVCGY